MITRHFSTACIVALTILFTGCDLGSGPSNGIQPGNGQFIDLGFIPAAVNAGNSGFDFQSAIYHNDHVFVATSDGIWKNDRTKNGWTRAGLQDRIVTLLYKHPTIANKLYAGTKSNGAANDKTLFISNDGGQTWEPATAPIFETVDERYENYVSMAARPNNPNHIYANLEGGAMIAVSTDAGLTWKRMNDETSSYFGYGCNIAFIPGNENEIFQGAEAPLDDAWLGKYRIDSTDPAKLTNFEKVVDQSLWENRRPNEIKTYDFAPNTLYVGLEGALYKVTSGTPKAIFKSENDNFPYSYIRGIWVNRYNPNHIIFGGALNNNEQPMSLYETTNEGKNIVRIDNKLGLANPQVIDILETDNDLEAVVVLNDQEADKVKVVLYRHFLPE